MFRFQERKAQDLTPETRHLKPQQGSETSLTNGFDLHPLQRYRPALSLSNRQYVLKKKIDLDFLMIRAMKGPS